MKVINKENNFAIMSGGWLCWICWTCINLQVLLSFSQLYFAESVIHSTRTCGQCTKLQPLLPGVGVHNPIAPT